MGNDVLVAVGDVVCFGVIREPPHGVIGAGGIREGGCSIPRAHRRSSPCCVIGVCKSTIHYTRDRLICKLIGTIISEISCPGGVGHARRLIQKVQRHAHRRRHAVTVAVTGLPAGGVVTPGRHQRRTIHLSRPGAGQKLPIAVVGIGDRTVVRIGLGGHQPAIVVAPACLLRSVGVLEGLQRRLHAEAVVGVFHRVGRPVYPFHFTCRVIGRIGHNIARRRHFRLAPHIVIFEAGGLAVDRLRQLTFVICNRSETNVRKISDTTQ